MIEGLPAGLPDTTGVRGPRRWWLENFRWFGRSVIRCGYRIHAHGAGNVPKHGPVLFVSNHIGVIDGPLLAIFAPRPVHALTKASLFHGFGGRFLTAVGQVPIDRTGGDPAAIKACVQALRAGRAVGIYPEGTRGAGEYDEYHHGAAYLAMVTGAPIVPVTMFGSRDPGGTPQLAAALPGRDRHGLRSPVAHGTGAVAASAGTRTPGLGVAQGASAGRARLRPGADRPRPSGSAAPARPLSHARRWRRRSTNPGPRPRSIMTDSYEQPTDLDASSMGFGEDDEHVGPTPVLAVVGRPNVGKSSLVNRIIGRREAVVEDVPGVTRDRVSYDADWNGRSFTIVDTGGWSSDAKGMALRIAEQAELAISLADAVLFVVDATVGITDEDEAVVRILRKAKKPVVLAANKVDDLRTETEAATLWNLGLGEPMPVSALHGRGSGDLLDAVLAALPELPEMPEGTPLGGPRRIALVGRPNVGKSSLLNKLAGETRVVVDNVAGTTVDPVDELIELGGRTWKFIDTAGIRKRVKEASGHEYYASLRTTTAIDRAEVAILVLDAEQSIAEQDVRILQTVREAGRALVIVFNKWDLVDDERRYYLEKEIERELVQVQWAPRINLTARTGWHIDRLVPAIDRALEGWETRVGTGALNTFLGKLVAEHPHPVRGGKQPKVLFATQPTTAPPTFILFTSGKLDAAYERFIERRLREEFGFVGTPIVLQQRVREKRKRTR
jgi:GTP-binding protein